MQQILPDQIIWPIIIILSSLSSLAGVVVAVYRTRRMPPLPEEIAKTYATKAELCSLTHRIESADNDLREQLSRMDSSWNHQIRDIMRSLGRIEGKVSGKGGGE